MEFTISSFKELFTLILLLIKFHLIFFRGDTPETRGTAFVVYEDIFDAKNACDHLSGFNVCGRYLVVLYYQANKAFKKIDTDKKQGELDKVKTKYGINTEEVKWSVIICVQIDFFCIES